MFELHRLTREIVLEWLARRREADGIVSSTQKRRPQRLRGGGATVFIEDGTFEPDDSSNGRRNGSSSAGPGPGSGEDGGWGAAGGRRSNGGGEEDVLMSLMSDVAPSREAAAPQEAQASNCKLYSTGKPQPPRRHRQVTASVRYRVALLQGSPPPGVTVEDQSSCWRQRLSNKVWL